MLNKIVKGAVKGIGTVTKIGAEITAEAVGVISENINNSPESKEKFSKIGKDLGNTIKENTERLADKSEKFTEAGVEAIKNAVEYGKDKADEIKQKKLQKDFDRIGKKEDENIIDAEFVEKSQKEE